MSRNIWIGLAVTALAFFTACGGGSEETTDDGNTMTDPPPPETTGSEGTADVIPSPPMAWAEMSDEDKGAWMRDEVLPRMTTMFQDFDGERYASVTCATCHGAGVGSGNFEMPTNDLPALPATGTPEQQAMVDQYTEMATFMFQGVLPAMQTLVGAEPYNEETQEGFSCYSCHPHAGDEGATLIELTAAAE